MIQVSDLNKRFGRFHALKGIDLSVEKGDIYGFLGHNGAGKSTTINILAGLSRIDSGKCIVNGIHLDAKLNAGQKGVGYLPEEPSFYSWMTAREYLTYVGSDYDGKTTNRVQEMLEWVDLKKAADRKIGGFSRGMKQRLGMAVTLFYDPDLLLLDEPSSALDPQGRSDVLNMITRLKDDDKTIFLSTHILDDVERVCNKVGILSHGEMVAEMELSKLLDKYVAPIYDIKFGDNPIADEIALIKSSDFIKSLEIENNIVTIKVDDSIGEDHKIYALAGKMQTPIKSVVQRQNSLEEIFISITGKGGEKCDKQ